MEILSKDGDVQPSQVKRYPAFLYFAFRKQRTPLKNNNSKLFIFASVITN